MKTISSTCQPFYTFAIASLQNEQMRILKCCAWYFASPGWGGGGDTSVRNGRLLFRGAKGRNVVLPILSLELWVNKHTM